MGLKRDDCRSQQTAPSKADKWKMEIAIRAARAALEQEMEHKNSYGARKQDDQLERLKASVV